MQLRTVDIRDYRSIFVADSGQPLRIELAEGANTLVGQNNCGKSNVLRAIALAIDPNQSYDAQVDQPGPRPFAHPVITLGFTSDRTTPEEAAALDAAGRFERSLVDRTGEPRASAGEIVLRVAFVPEGTSIRREERLIPASGRIQADGESEELQRDAISALRNAVRFVLISSGESIESVLEGNFREILHSVVRDRLRAEFEGAERSRIEYVAGLQESLLRPLRERLATDVRHLFPEIDGVSLSPDVSSIEETLSNVDVMVDDLVSTPLAAKGTGVRGGVLVAMLSYLAVNATRGMIFALEEPEAFLHPAAQEQLRDQLEEVACAAGITLLVTSHSPFIVTRSPNGRVFCLGKDTAGRTRLGETAQGDADHAPLVGGLLRDQTIDSLLSSSSVFPVGTQAVVLVEGEGDLLCMRLAADVVDRPDLLDGLAIRPTGGTVRMIAQAVITKAASELPLVIVTDNDDAGQKVKSTLVGNTFGFSRKQIVNYVDVYDNKWQNFPVEAEDLFEPSLLDGFVDAHGESIMTGKVRRPDDAWHYDLDQSAKEELSSWLVSEARPHHVAMWLELLLAIRGAAKLEVPDVSVQEMIEAAPAVAQDGGVTRAEGDVLVLAGKHDYARYQSDHAIAVELDTEYDDDVTHIAFYSRGIQPHVPAVLAEHPNLLFSEETVHQLRGTGKDLDERVADFVEKAVRNDDQLVGRSWRVLLLSDPDDEATLVLEAAVPNTKQLGGRPVAWTIGPKVIPFQVLAERPANTDEIDRAIAEMGSQP